MKPRRSTTYAYTAGDDSRARQKLEELRAYVEAAQSISEAAQRRIRLHREPGGSQGWQARDFFERLKRRLCEAVGSVQSKRRPQVPAIAGKAWAAFWELDGARGHNGWSYQPITHADLAAFQQPPGPQLKSWERSAILAMDKVRRAYLNDPDGQTETSATPMSSALFDAVFG